MEKLFNHTSIFVGIVGGIIAGWLGGWDMLLKDDRVSGGGGLCDRSYQGHLYQDTEFRDGLQGASEKDCDVHRDRSSIFDSETVE